MSATNAPGTPAPDIPGSDASAPDTPEKGRVDWPAFLTCIAVVLLASVPLALFPEAGERLLTTGYDFIADRLGFLYAFAGFGVFVLLSWLAFGRYGKVKLGRDEDEVEYSDFSWTAMLFCAGVGAGRSKERQGSASRLRHCPRVWRHRPRILWQHFGRLPGRFVALAQKAQL